MKDLKKMMGKDEDGDKMKKEAKLSVLQELRKMASDMMGEDVKGGMEAMKKVSVVARPTESDKAGIDTGKDVVGYQATNDSVMEPDDMEEEHTPDDLDAEIARLQALKAKKMQR